MTKPEPVPSVLYKYCQPARIDVLKNGQIVFSQASALNDILEMRPVSEFKLDGYAEGQKQLFRLNRHLHNPHLQPPSDEENAKHLNETLGQEVFCLCLVNGWNNCLMWSYYADAHRGFVIGFDTANQDLFQSEPRQVKYSPERPTFGYHDEDAWNRAIFTKADYWCHEKEWRAVRIGSKSLTIGARTACGGVDPTSLAFATLQPQAVREIVIGNRADPAFRNNLCSCLRERYEHVAVYDAVPDPKTWTLNRFRE